MSHRVRIARLADAPALAELTHAAIERTGRAAYSTEQVTAWAARHPSAERFGEQIESGAWIVAAIDEADRPIAYALMEPDGHVDMLYTHPDHARRGLATRLLELTETEGRQRSLTRLYTEASDLARPAFERAGYAVTGRRDFEIDGVPIHNWAMERRFT